MSKNKGKVYKPHPPKNYSEAFKRQIVSEYERGLNTKAGLKLKYGILGNSCITSWCKQFGKLTYTESNVIGRPMKDPQKQRIKELEEQLRQKSLELEAYQNFISIAERELQIKIVKKSGSKQSKK
jgi:transposase-like protein